MRQDCNRQVSARTKPTACQIARCCNQVHPSWRNRIPNRADPIPSAIASLLLQEPNVHQQAERVCHSQKNNPPPSERPGVWPLLRQLVAARTNRREDKQKPKSIQRG